MNTGTLQTLKRHYGPAENRPVAMIRKMELPGDTELRTGQHEQLVEAGEHAGDQVIVVQARRVTVQVGHGLHNHHCEGDHVVLLVLDRAASHLHGTATNSVLEAPGPLASYGLNIRDSKQLAVLPEDLAQDAAGVVCPSKNPTVCTPTAFPPPGLHTTEGAEELAILPQDLAQDATRAFRPTETLATWLRPLRRLPSLTSEKTRKNLCTSGWLSATLPLVSQAF
ncbi:hypothetical protein V5799_034041 [Amblyomma americanum]|uniref:Uncharacterized protein n=1 Tax=Amblyomma americanum TaxID=6943 RepID=A0AAQ4DLK5_AMBAM